MPYANSIDSLRFTRLTENVYNIDEPLGLLTQVVFGASAPEFPGTDRIEFGTETRVARSAPFIPVSADAVIVGDRTQGLQTIDSVNMALRMSIRPGDIAHDRSMGEAIHVSGSGVSRVNGLQARIDRYQTDMKTSISYSKEWWASQAILGVVTFNNSAFDAFTIDFGRPAGNTITITPYWTDATAAVTNNIQAAKRQVSSAESLNVTLALCGREAADAIRASAQIRAILDIRRYDTGNVLDSSADYMKRGAMTYIGRINGIEFWEVDHTIPMQTAAGSTFPVIRSKYVEFMAVGPQIMAKTMYAPIFDLELNGGNAINTEWFSKAWDIKYPSQRWIVVQSRPNMIPKKPGFGVSMQIVA
jgi:hypothetical protein